MAKIWSPSTLCLLALFTWGVRETSSETLPPVCPAPNPLSSPPPACLRPYVPTHNLWEVHMTPDKGRGVFARVDIRRGTQLMVEDPLLTISVPPPVPGVGSPLAAIQPVLADAFAQLTPMQKRQFLSCHEVRFGDEGKDEEGDNDNASSGRLMRIFRSNAYYTLDMRVGLYPHVALINHDCRPNVLNTEREVQGAWQRLIVAARDIAAGEELVTTYVPLLADTATRRARLAQYGFTCMCETCAATSAQREKDDAVRVRMKQELDELQEHEGTGGDRKKSELGRLAQRAAKLATYVADRGFADYAVKTSRLAYTFALWAGDTEAEKHWLDVHRADLELAGQAEEMRG